MAVTAEILVPQTVTLSDQEEFDRLCVALDLAPPGWPTWNGYPYPPVNSFVRVVETDRPDASDYGKNLIGRIGRVTKSADADGDCRIVYLDPAKRLEGLDDGFVHAYRLRAYIPGEEQRINPPERQRTTRAVALD